MARIAALAERIGRINRGLARGDTNTLVYERVALQRALQAWKDEIAATPLGHSDFTGGDRFDYTREDKGWTWPGNPFAMGRHFRYLDDSEADIDRALVSCDKEAFERAMHRGQDFFSHFGAGYRWYTAGHLFRWNEPDDSEKYRWRWEMAEFWTRQQIQKWDENCEKKCHARPD